MSMNEIESDDLQCYTLAEACEKLQLSTTTAVRLIKEGKLRAFKSGHGWRISRAALNDFISGQEAKITKK